MTKEFLQNTNGSLFDLSKINEKNIECVCGFNIKSNEKSNSTYSSIVELTKNTFGGFLSQLPCILLIF